MNTSLMIKIDNNWGRRLKRLEGQKGHCKDIFLMIIKDNMDLHAHIIRVKYV